ncbi:HvfB family MNIO-type RiPP peptide maturase [Methylocaldum sp. GT1BB]|uniref:HvfB family MNIO-type RiPP peptide maturase n=1 Tax=Methylocaldum sp. GT1BB TaxID=3438963 RepID=UPI003D9FB36B
MKNFAIQGAGLGLRRAFIGPLTEHLPESVDFYEIAPENWMRIGGKLGKQLRTLTERFPFVCHGLSLSLGGPAPLDEEFLTELKTFLDRHHIRLYSEHLSYCGDDGHLYDLMPIPFTEEAVKYTAERIIRTQEILERRIAIENISYYAAPGKELEEIDFLNAVLEEADCDLLLDINNIYVNSVNHGYDAEAFLSAIPAHRIAYAHVAGHYVEAVDFLVDTHGATVIDPVWRLLSMAYEKFGVFPTLLERDFNIPALSELLSEVQRIRALQTAASSQPVRRYG